MRIRIVNPNSTVSMTEKIARAARLVAAAGTEIAAATSVEGPPSIQGYADGVLALPGLLKEIGRGEADGVDAHVIACFDDTGLDPARALAKAPVIGIGEAGYHVASLIARRFSVVTTLSASVPILEDNLRRYGLIGRCVRVRASEVPVLALEEPGSNARRRISAEIGAAIAEDHAEAIVLGCAGMADLAHSLEEEHGVPVVDGVTAAVKLAESLVGLGLSTSKSGGWAFPRSSG
jgi:allantoin racemase